MSKVGVVTDSTCCLPEELVKEYGIRVVPVVLTINGKPYKDGVDITPGEFWKMFKGLDTLPTTSTPSAGDFVEVIRDLAKSTDSIICIMVSGALSGTYSAALHAKDITKSELPGLKVEVVDSKIATGALGFVVLEAARASCAGKSLSEIVQIVEGMLSRVRYLTAFETLKYLIKGGRAPKAALIGELLQVKQIITNDNKTGLIIPIARARGRRKSMAKMVDMVKEYIDPDKPLHMMVHYTDDVAGGEELKTMVTARYNCAELYMTPYTPVMACHTGPVLSLSFYS